MTQIVLKTTIWSLCLIFSFSNLNAQIDTPLDDDTPEFQIPPGTAIIDNQRANDLNDGSSNSLIIDNCENFVDAYVFVTSLERKHEGAPYEFPDGATPIFLAYEIPYNPANPGTGANTGVIEVPAASFEFTGMIDPESGMRIFESLVKIPADFATVCQGFNGITSTSFNIEIVADLEGTPYPFQLNNHPKGLFSCRVFCDECPAENTYSYCIDNIYLTPWTGAFLITCNGCGNDVDGTFMVSGPEQGNNFTHDKNEQQVASELAPPLKVIPNPASLETEIMFHSENPEEVELLIFDATGRAVYSQATKAAVGNNKININVNAWEKGIYYGYLKSKNDTQSFRFLKL